MQIIIKEELHFSKQIIYQKIVDGAIFIHPTDTIYGIGCNAMDSTAVRKARIIKGRPITPFSVIAPSKEWIYKNCHIPLEARKWINKLPGPYTLILNKNNTQVAEEVTPGINTIGVRIPDHWFADIVSELQIPVITTSANIVHEDFMTSLEDLDVRIKSKIDFMIYEGQKPGKPSKIIDLTKEVSIIER